MPRRGMRPAIGPGPVTFHSLKAVLPRARVVRQLAVLLAEQEVDDQADRQPDEEAHPRLAAAGSASAPGSTGSRAAGSKRHQRHAEAARPLRLLLRSTITPAETTTKANSVPMLDRSANVPMSQMPAGMPTANPAIQVLTCGVWCTGWTLEKSCGSSPSRDMANHTRACPY